MAAVREAIEQRRGHAFTLEDLAPLAKGEVAGDQDAAALVAVGEDLEEQLGSRAAEAQIAQLVDDQEIGLVELGQQAVQAVLLLRFLQRRHQCRGGEEADPLVLPTRGLAQGDR